MDRITDLLPYICNELPNCPEAVVLQHLRRSLSEFCRDTEAWQEELVAMALVADQTDYNLDTGWDANVHRIVWVKLNSSTNATDPNNYTLSEDYTLVLANAPATADADGLEVKIVLMPTPDCEDLPEWFMDRYNDALQAVTKYRLMMQKNKVWMDRELGIFYKKEYDKLVNLAKMENLWKYRTAGVTVAQRDWY